ncbi:MAG: single-stranded-DNA-specific exonuclease RecJ [Lachnospiraceae bacterium]|nr:single-stranded-DNA-specific exonuclease RecJ [Lachnospiraceae bacterium]
MAEWLLVRQGADYEALSKEYHIDPVILRIMRNRGITEREQILEYLSNDMAVCDRTDGYVDMDKAIDYLLSLQNTGHKIRIIGDYDADGVCSTAILYKGLNALGLQPDYAIPHRMLDGYGINVSLVERAYADGIKTLLTCDNGIAAFEALERAAELGMQVIVTDHHEVRKETVAEREQEKLPPAYAIINPKRDGNDLDFTDICGAYVAYKMIVRLLTRANLLSENETLQEELRVLAAVATVGDVMPLIKENRMLVKFGLEHIKQCKNTGLKALLEANQLNDKSIKAYTLGFVLDPCINAMGRLESAEQSLELLLCDEYDTAIKIAGQLVETNNARKALTDAGVKQAIDLVSKEYAEDDIIVVYLKDCHESIAGIIAGRVREAFYKPVWIFTDAAEGIKGSGRSIAAYDMNKGLCQCEDLLTHFGGHKLAAGASLPKENLEALRRRLNEDANLTKEDLTEVIRIDVDMPFDYADENFVQELNLLEPYGKDNEKPIFAQGNVTFLRGRIFGARNNVASFRVKDSRGAFYDLKYFGDIPTFNRFIDEKYGEGSAECLYRGNGNYPMSVIYSPDLNTYNGRTQVQLVMKNYR